MMSDTIPILMNTHAGAMHAAGGQEQLQRMAHDAGLDAEIIHTESTEDLTKQLKRLVSEKRERVAVAGGDGTVGLAVQTLAHTNTALGILSQGTFNNFASALRIPHNLPAALRALATGEIHNVDLGKVGDRYFTESAGVGLFADALALYGAGSNKNFFRGLYATTRLTLAFRAQEMHLTIDGTSYDERITICEIANTYRIAQAVPIAPEADVDDGVFDIVMITDLKRREVLPYLRAMRAQMHLNLPKVKVIKGKTIKIESHKRRNVHCDDKVIGMTPLEISIQPGALKVIIPKEI